MSVLDELVAGAVEDAKAREAKVSLDELKERARKATAETIGWHTGDC